MIACGFCFRVKLWFFMQVGLCGCSYAKLHDGEVLCYQKLMVTDE